MRLSSEQSAERERLFTLGYNDELIANAVGVDRTTIRDWRKSRGLPSNHLTRLSSQLAERSFLYERGIGDALIARHQGVNPSSIRKWRYRRCLRSNNPPSSSIDWSTEYRELYNQGLSDKRISRILHKGVGFGHFWRRKLGLPRNYEPLFCKRRAGAATQTSNTTRIKSIADISLDEPNNFGRARIEYLRDDSWSNWLEEMGATVW